jgi:hypothetical protein
MNVVILWRKHMASGNCCLMATSLAPVNSAIGCRVSGKMQAVICPVVRLSEELSVFILGHLIP